MACVGNQANYIAQSNVVNGEHIYHYYNVRDPIVVEDLTLTGEKVIYPAKITLYDSRFVTVRNNTLQNSPYGIYIAGDSKLNEITNNEISRTRD
jgi:parallel beta-helix repeat protein